MSGVFRNIDPQPITARRMCLWCGGRTHSLGGEGVGGSIVRKTSDTALYSIKISALWLQHSPCLYTSAGGFFYAGRSDKKYKIGITRGTK
jgi:hypothetical protein